jgi:hypothetical protein
MTQIITTTGTMHIVEDETADWRQDRSVCGHTGTARDATVTGVGQHIDDVCETCRANADDGTMMEIYELADEAGD